MDKKILLCGSIIAVVVLVLASLSPVVGFNSVKSSAIDSPLFSVRIKRVINEESEGLTCDYVGKGKESSLLFLRENNSLKMKEIIDIINTLDDEEFKRFQNPCGRLLVNITY